VAGETNFWVRWRVRAGYPVALLYLVLASPTPRSIAWGAVVAVSGLFVRGTAAGYLRKQEVLTVTGPYAWTRNPLYFGSALLAAGFAMAGNSIWGATLVVGYYLAFYPAVMRREESQLRARYAAVFNEYAARVPLFWPWPPRKAPDNPSPNTNGFSWAQYVRNREYQAALGFLVGLALLWLRMLVAATRG
jgi:protein-S-isoprenylcysteine O-methyltransferase Ste14